MPGSDGSWTDAREILDVLFECDTLEKAADLLYRVRITSGIEVSSFISGVHVSVTYRSQRDPPETTVDSFEPKTGRLLAKVTCSREETVRDAVEAAKAAFPAWSKTTRAQRSQHLQRVAQLIQEHAELFAVWESIDQGKTIERARVEVERAVANFSYFSTYILHEQTTSRMVDGVAITYEHRSPAGLFALISPWNMPLYLLTWKIAPCLAFGCTAVAKPSEATSMTAFLLTRIFELAHLPPGVINIIFGDGQTGDALVRAKGINGISFTGSTSTGVAIRRATVENISKKLSLELGGKNPTVVFADAMSSAYRVRSISIAAMAAFENAGQICLCGSRIYVEKSVYADFLRQFVKHVTKRYTLRKRVGAVASREHYNKIRGYLQMAADQGATFELGGVPPELAHSAAELMGNNEAADDDDNDPLADGYWIAPTILTNVKEDSDLQRHEIFGPVVTVTPFSGGEDEAIRLANDSDYGLAAVLLTADGARTQRVGEQLDAGLVWVNSWLVRELGTPFGGMKQSGIGREGGDYSRDTFTNVRTIHLPLLYA
ncbi:aldehyde dehydrogenase domain-containing protein [Podospora didyma]|uniref:Aldehyde dehydrogenase domain-containing protein n=1 Tax=Podospora didyma TaxID=330526 RepID=A0AAE0U7H9_9PEZI|nr:aldehyde dehydrogenase domain-containing protein [Podospora didyma]